MSDQRFVKVSSESENILVPVDDAGIILIHYGDVNAFSEPCEEGEEHCSAPFPFYARGIVGSPYGALTAKIVSRTDPHPPREFSGTLVNQHGAAFDFVFDDVAIDRPHSYTLIVEGGAPPDLTVDIDVI